MCLFIDGLGLTGLINWQEFHVNVLCAGQIIGIQCCCFRSHIYHVRGRQLNPQSTPFLFPITNSLTHSLSLKHLEAGCAVTYTERRGRDTHTHAQTETAVLQRKQLFLKSCLQKTLDKNRNWQFIYLLVHLFLPLFSPAHFFIDRNHLFLARVQIAE